MNAQLPTVMSKLKELDFIVNVWLLSPTDFGIGYKRDRIWILGVRRAHVRHEDQFRAHLDDLMDRFVGHRMVDLGAFLLDEGDPTVQKYYDSIINSSRIRQSSSAHTWDKGREEIVQAMEKRGISADCLSEYPSESILEAYPGLRALSHRAWCILQAHGVTESCLPENPPRVVDLTQSILRSSPSSAQTCHTITPRGIHFHTGRVRKLLGLESLRLQGICLERKGKNESEHAVQDYSDTLLQSLAGNTFPTHCAAAVLLCMFVAVSTSAKGANHHGGVPCCLAVEALAWHRAPANAMDDASESMDDSEAEA